jgi:uncharacterized protein (TIGR01319 family)
MSEDEAHVAKTLGNQKRFCITDVGSTTTKAILFDSEDGRWRFLRRESPTTVEKPYEDVSIGVTGAIRAVERDYGSALIKDGRPSVPYLSTSSAGGGLAVVVTGLVKDLTAKSADRVALGAGAIVLDVISMNDGRTPYRKVEDLKRLRPDMVLLAGGFDGDNISGPVYLAELIVESGIHPKLNPDAKLDIIFGGNANAEEYVARVLGKDFQFHSVPNIRPDGKHENPGPARELIHDLFRTHVMSQAPGYERIKAWVAAPILPTPAAFAGILALISRDYDKAIMAVDIGGATTDVYSARAGTVFRTVSANLGMSYSIRNVVELGGPAAIRAMHPTELSDTELWNRIGNKHINPTSLPDTPEAMATEWAVATVAVREAVRQHLEVMHTTVVEEQDEHRIDIDILIRGARRPWRRELEVEGKLDFALEDYDLVIGSGGILSHSPREAAAMMLLDALQPNGIVEFAVDSAFMFPHLGMLAEVDEELAKRLFRELGIVRLGTVWAPAGHEAAASISLKGKKRSGGEIKVEAGPGEVVAIPLGEDDDLDLSWGPAGEEEAFAVRGGVCGIIVDNRERPVARGANNLVKEAYVPPARPEAAEKGERMVTGGISMNRELAIPGQVLVTPGETVKSETLVARSVRQFLRPFFLSVAREIEVEPEELEGYLTKHVGDEIRVGDVIARKPRRMLPAKVYRSAVKGRIERVLRNGTLVVREAPELAREYTTVNVAEDLGKPAWEVKSYLRVKPGQHVERGQWLAADLRQGALKSSASPVRGKVNRIDYKFGMVVIEPLLEELEVHAWLPGKVGSISDRGCAISAEGTVIHGVWGLGGEAAGPLSMGEPSRGGVVALDFTDADTLAGLKEMGIAGLVTGGINLQDMIGADPGFTIVVIQGFGRESLPAEIRRALEQHEGNQALVDGLTQLRVGVVRPRVILPGGRP